MDNNYNNLRDNNNNNNNNSGWFKKKGNPLLAAILKYFLAVINFSVYIFGKIRLFYVSGEEMAAKSGFF